MSEITVTLTEEQQGWLQEALSDAYAFREQEDPDNSDGAFEDVDAPRREHAEVLAELFGFDIT